MTAKPANLKILNRGGIDVVHLLLNAIPGKGHYRVAADSQQQSPN